MTKRREWFDRNKDAFQIVRHRLHPIDPVNIPLKPDESLQLPSQPIDRLVSPLSRFLRIESSSGFLLLACAFAALIIANSPLADEYEAFWKSKVGFTVGGFTFYHSLRHLVNDGLMVLFFFVIGMEVKRELVEGTLADFRRAALPIAAALGGMIVPALIYVSIQYGQPAMRGWGIPMATDIAFVVGCLAVFGIACSTKPASVIVITGHCRRHRCDRCDCYRLHREPELRLARDCGV